jgi:hypothetical protein
MGLHHSMTVLPELDSEPLPGALFMVLRFICIAHARQWQSSNIRGLRALQSSGL